MGMEDTVNVDAHHLIKLSRRLFEKGRFDAQDAGATDQDIDAPKDVGALVCQRLDGDFVSHIGAHVACLLAQRFDLGDHSLALFIQQIGDHDIAPGLGQTNGAGAAKATRAAGDNRQSTFNRRSKTEVGH